MLNGFLSYPVVCMAVAGEYRQERGGYVRRCEGFFVTKAQVGWSGGEED